ncbi:MAG: hypothetical protein ACHQCG_01390 [Solirubrobacterales bacterium]|jgi:hypothetical protein
MARIAMATTLVFLLGGLAWGQRGRPPGSRLTLPQTLAQIDVGARAIRGGQLPLDALERQALELRRQVSTLPALTVGQPAVVRTFEVRMDDASARLVDRASARDRDGAADAAGDLLDELDELKTTLGIAP